MTTLHDNRNSVAALMGGVLHSASKIAVERKRLGEYRKTVRTLQLRSDRELEDLGFNRADIEKVAREATFA